MSIPIHIQFPWQAKVGEITETGRGLLSPSIKAKSGELVEFKVAVGNLIAAAYPKRGELHLDHHAVYRCPCRQPHKLIWKWQMSIELSSNPREKNTGAPSFGCHVIGLECAENKFAVRFMRDGTVKHGFE